MKKLSVSPKRKLVNISVKELIDTLIYRIDVDAEYQREKIWTTKQQELLLDSIIRDIDIPKIYIVEVKNNQQFEFDCIDGKQRMTALLRYIKPDASDKTPLTIRMLEEKYTLKQLKVDYPNIAKKVLNYELSFTIYNGS